MKGFAMLKIGEVGWIEKERPACVEVAKKYGADDFISYKNGTIEEQVMKHTNGEGVDRVIMAGGSVETFESAIKPLLHGDISLLKPVVVLSPRNYSKNMKEWEALYRDQVANAKIVVFSKCENESPEVLAETEKAIRNINPNAEILSRHYTKQDDEWWRSVMNILGEKKSSRLKLS
jgi:NADPH:quinone reductase-like Zn-dependent oxidoreductase